MINIADQIKIMANTLVEKSQGTKRLTTNGCPRYSIQLEDLLDLGFTRSKIENASKGLGIRITKTEKLSFESYNLRQSIIDLLEQSKA